MSRQTHVRAYGRMAGWAMVTLGLSAVPVSALAATMPDFGANVVVFSPGMPTATMQAKIDAAYAVEHENEFGAQRYAFLFLPGQYRLNVPVGFYTEVAGLGGSPDDVHITGNVHADASARNNNATVTFWRGVEGFAVTPTGGATEGTMKWAVSQAAPMRRMHIEGSLVLHQLNGWASGGWMADTKVDGDVGSGTQQQWISRNSEWKSWTGANWNMVFVGVPHPPAGEWPEPPYTKIAHTPVIREKPFLMVDAKGRYRVRVPALQHSSTGITWSGGGTPGRSIPLSHFYVAHAGTDTAATINAQLGRGKDLLLTPGIYELKSAIHVARPDTVVLGLGFATLRPTEGTAAMTTADANGISIAGLLFDAGPAESPVLLQIGPKGSHADHAHDPISLHDVFFRVGGAGPGKTVENLEVNSNDTLIDHTWIWRADHGKGVGWGVNTSENGLVVNGNDVTAYGLFVEHHQHYQVLWNGERGRTYFYQSEIPYDAPNQAVYTSAPGVDGWASYKVADAVKQHEAWGLGIYSVFNFPHVFLTRAIEVPKTPGVRFHHIITVALGRQGGAIRNVINDTGGSTEPAPHRVTPKVTQYP